jgi:hypothetical protein
VATKVAPWRSPEESVLEKTYTRQPGGHGGAPGWRVNS